MLARAPRCEQGELKLHACEQWMHAVAFSHRRPWCQGGRSATSTFCTPSSPCGECPALIHVSPSILESHLQSSVVLVRQRSSLCRTSPMSSCPSDTPWILRVRFFAVVLEFYCSVSWMKDLPFDLFCLSELSFQACLLPLSLVVRKPCEGCQSSMVYSAAPLHNHKISALCQRTIR